MARLTSEPFLLGPQHLAQVQRLLLKRQRATLDPRRIDEILDQTSNVRHLSLDHGARLLTRRDVLSRPHHRQGDLNRGQRIPELVRQQAEEVLLAATERFDAIARGMVTVARRVWHGAGTYTGCAPLDDRGAVTFALSAAAPIDALTQGEPHRRRRRLVRH